MWITPLQKEHANENLFVHPYIDYVYTLYPTKSTPRTNEWYPKGAKYFSFTFQAYDLDRELRDPFWAGRDAKI